MPYSFIKDFKNGVDRRRRQSAVDAGTLYTLINAHITRGGDVEKRKAFASKYTLPAGTFGLHNVAGTLYVFGSVADPGVPAGVTYQRLQHPGGSSYSMTAVVAVENFNGAPYVVAEFSDGYQYHFYDGSQVFDWHAGIVRPYMTNNAGIATHLKNVIDADPDFSATVVSNQITITGPIGEDFEIELTTENGGATDDQTLTHSVIRSARASIEEARAVGNFSILGGSSGASNKVTSVTAGGTALLGAAVSWATNNAVTAADVATEINDNTSSGLSHGYEASSQSGVVYIYAPFGEGADAEGQAVVVTVTGDVIIGDGSFKITGGTNSAGVNKIDSVKVDGSNLLSGAIDWATSNSATASAIATDIRSGSGSHGYTAFATGETVRVSKLVTSSADDEITLLVTTSGDVTVGGGATPSTATGSGGSNPLPPSSSTPPPGQIGYDER